VGPSLLRYVAQTIVKTITSTCFVCRLPFMQVSFDDVVIVVTFSDSLSLAGFQSARYRHCCICLLSRPLVFLFCVHSSSIPLGSFQLNIDKAFCSGRLTATIYGWNGYLALMWHPDLKFKLRSLYHECTPICGPTSTFNANNGQPFIFSVAFLRHPSN